MTTSDVAAGRVAVLGAGVMGEAVLTGVLRAGWSPDLVIATTKSPQGAEALRAAHGIEVGEDNARAVEGAGVVVLAVKPKDVAEVLAEISPVLAGAAEPPLVISVAVGLPTAFYETRLPAGVPVVRVMPNTPAVIGQGISAISGGTHAGDEHLAVAERLLASTGEVVRVPEKDQDAVAALSGSGPAYVFYVVDALAEAGVRLGLSRELSQRLAVSTVRGSAELARRTGEHPAILRERVSSPGGTTVAALHVLDAAAVRAAFVEAAAAAVDRAQELAADLA